MRRGCGSVSPPADVAHEARIVALDDGQGGRLSRLEAGSRLDDSRVELGDGLRELDEHRGSEARLLGVVQHLEPTLPVGGYRDPETDAFAADHRHPVIVGRVFHSRWSGHLGGPYPSRMSTEPHLLLADGQEHSVAEWEGPSKSPSAAQGPPPRRGRPGGALCGASSRTPRWTASTSRPSARPRWWQTSPTRSGPPARGDGWDVRALLADPDASASNAAALTDLENGATSLWLQVGASGIDVADLPAVLKGVLLDVAAVVLDAPSDPLAAAQAFADVAEGQTLAAGTNLGVDPVGARVRGLEAADEIAEVSQLAQRLGCRALVVDGAAVHDLGASDVQELGYVLALGAHYLRALDAAGISVDDAAGLVEFRLAASDEQFVTIAKLRAVRRLWAGCSAQWRVRGPPHDEPARGDLATDDDQTRPVGEHAAHLRRCLRCRCGWCRCGHGAAVRLPPRDSGRVRRRIARNTSTLLVEESMSPRSPTPPVGRTPSRSSPTTSPSPAGPSSAGSSPRVESRRPWRTAPCARGSTRSSQSATARSPRGLAR